jgi:peptidoglycan/xylan/chitin deacetylase (PgdA/CDA1 family)
MKAIGYQVIAQLGLPQLLHSTIFRKQVTIMTYHAVIRSPLDVYDWCFLDEFSFRRQAQYVKRHFDVIPLSEAVVRMRTRRICQPTVVITFDDGFQNNYDVAFPILYELRLPATIFLITGLVNTSDTPWFCRLHRAVTESSRAWLEWGDFVLDLAGPEAKAKTLAVVWGKLKEFPHPRLLIELQRLILELGDDPGRPVEVGSPFRMLSREAITKMAGSGLIEFGAHTHSHAILSLLGPEERHNEIERSVAATEEMTSRPCELFAYPNGSIQDYDVNIIRTLEACGVHTAVTTIESPNDSRTPAMELRRYGIGAGDSMAYFQLKIHHFIAQLRRMMK